MGLFRALVTAFLCALSGRVSAQSALPPPPPLPSPPSPPSPPSSPPTPPLAPQTVVAYRIDASFVAIEGNPKGCSCFFRKEIVQQLRVPATLVEVVGRGYLLPPSPPPLPPSLPSMHPKQLLPKASSITKCERVREHLPLLPAVTMPPPPPPPDTTGEVPIPMSTEVDVSLWVARLGHAHKLSVMLDRLLRRSGVQFQSVSGPRCEVSITPVPVSAAMHERMGLMLNNGSLEQASHWLWCDGCGRLIDYRTFSKTESDACTDTDAESLSRAANTQWT